jgi:HEAT repeat protein
MNLLVPILLASFIPQGTTQKPPRRLPTKHGRITLPPVTREPIRAQEKPRARTDSESFYRAVINLRRSKILSTSAEEVLLLNLKQNYKDPAKLAVELAARCKNDLLHGLMKVVDRYGDKYHAEQMHFQVLTRAMGHATSRVIKTITQKAGSVRAKQYLFDYMVAKHAPVRSAAAALLPNYLVEEDIPRLLLLSRERKADIRRKVVGILAGVDDVRVRKRILQMLTQDSSLAADACVAAIAHGPKVIDELTAIVSRPARGRSFGYAAFAVVRIEKNTGKAIFTKEMVPHILRELAGEDPFLKATSAIALGSFAHRVSDWTGHSVEDKMIVEGLLGLVAPEKFIASLQLLQPVALDVLVKFSGRNFRTRGSAWRGWWQEAGPNFVGLRRTVAITEVNAEHAHILWNVGEHFLSFRGPKVAVKDVPSGATPYVLASDEFRALVSTLTTLGFMADNELPQTKDVWTIDLRVDSARALMRVDPSKGQGFHRSFAAVARREMWQKYRDPKAQPDATAFWRMERKWLAQNPGKEVRRLLWHIMRRLPGLDAKQRAVALDDLQSVPDLPKLITEEDASALVAVASKIEKFDKSDFRLLEIALIAPGDTTWRKVIGVLDRRKLSGAGDEFTTRLFQLLGPERVVTSIRHKSGPVAVAAMHDVAANRNQAAVPVLMARMKDPNADVCRTAIYALGVLHATQARSELIAYEAKAHPVIRRTIWTALGRIGGAGVPAILKRAMETSNSLDKLAALSAMGHTQSTELAQFLAARCVSKDPTDKFAQRAAISLRQLGPLLAIPALRPHLQMQEGPERQGLILMLGEFQDPLVVRDLIDLLRSKRYEVVAAGNLAEITGVDLRKVNDRVRRMYAWFADNRGKSQAQWFLDSLVGARVPTTLQVQHLTRRSGVGAVEELSRLMTSVKDQHIRVLCATMLRETTGKDFTRGVRYAAGATLTAIADRYKIYAASVRAASK